MQKLADIVSVNTRFCRSININKDLNNADILSSFICPASSEIALINMAEHVFTTKQSAFTWTGPYGSGKSSLALFLSALVGKDVRLREIANNIISKNILTGFKERIAINKGWDILPVVGRFNGYRGANKRCSKKKNELYMC